MKEDINTIRKLLEEIEGIGLHIKTVELNYRSLDPQIVQTDRMKKIKSNKYQTHKFVVHPFYKDISQF